jgi:hypothetical protein
LSFTSPDPQIITDLSYIDRTAVFDRDESENSIIVEKKADLEIVIFQLLRGKLKKLSLAFPASQFITELANIGRTAVFHRIESEKSTIAKKKQIWKFQLFC